MFMTKLHKLPHGYYRLIGLTVAVCWILPHAWAASTEGLKIGLGTAPITPNLDKRLAGYYFARSADGVHDHLWAKALVVDDGQKQIVMVSIDAIKVRAGFVDEACRHIQLQLGIPADHYGPTKKVKIQVFALGPLAFVGIPGEYFSDLGMQLQRQSPFSHTVVVGFAHDDCDYIPTRKAYEEGGYEPTAALLAPGAGEEMAEQALKLLRKLKN